MTSLTVGKRKDLVTLIELARLQAHEQPERSAYRFLVDGEEEGAHLSFAELDRRARAIAVRLCEVAHTGDRVLLLLPSNLEFVVAFFACLYAGVVAVPAYPLRSRRGLPRLAKILGDSAASVALTTSAIVSRSRSWAAKVGGFETIEWLVTDDLTPERVHEFAAAWTEPAADLDSVAFLQYTSGSTDAPKGVAVTHGNLLSNQEIIRRAFGQSERTVIVGWLPLFHDMGLVGNILQPLYVGASSVLMAPAAFLQKPLRWLQAIDRYRATTSGGPNFAYELCLSKIAPEQRAELDLSRWELAFNGAEPVRAGTLERFADAFAPAGFRREAFFPCYGLAEATLFVAGGEAGREPTVRRFEASALAEGRGVATQDLEDGRLLVGCGGSWGKHRIAIVDPDGGDPDGGVELPPGRVGEIWFAGPSVAAGYWQQPQETAHNFAAHLSRGEAEGAFLRTGDLGFMAEGELFVTGRIKDLIILRGKNHYPQDFETTAEASHPDLQEGGSAAFSIDEEGEERLVVVAELRRRKRSESETESVTSTVVMAVRRALAEAHQVQVHEVVLIRVGTLSKTSSGKVRRGACRDRYRQDALTVIARDRIEPGIQTPPDTDLEVSIAALQTSSEAGQNTALTIWLRRAVATACRVAPEKVPIAGAPTAVGLDSLGAVSVQQAAEEAFGVALDPEELLGGATLEEIAERIRTGLGAAPTPISAMADPEAAVPLSIGQQALFFLDRLSPQKAVLNLAAAARVHGELDHEALRLAVTDLAHRHPALVTVFTASGGPPEQRIRRSATPDFAVVDAPICGAELRHRLDEEARRPLDLAAGSPARWRVFVHSPTESTLLLVVHHLVADFWSVVTLLTDLETFYRWRHVGTGTAAPVPPVTATYAEYVLWQKDRLEGAAGERLRRFWAGHLAPPLTTLELPLDRPRPPVQQFRGAARSLVLPPEITEGLDRLARERGATLFMALLGLYQLLLHRASGQDELLVGTPTSGRGKADFANLVGYFVNPIVLRSRLVGEPSFGEFLEDLRTQALAAYTHQEYPFARLAEDLQPERDPSRSPIFQAMFTLHQAWRPESQGLAALALGCGDERMAWADLEFSPVDLGWHSAPFDLNLSMAASAGTLYGSFEYDADLFDATTVERLTRHFLVLATAAVAAPQRPVTTLPQLSVGERAQLVGEWSDSAAPPPTETSVHRLIEARVASNPDRIAVVRGGLQVAYGEFDRRANRLAHYLRSLGAGAEVRVGVYLDRFGDVVTALLAILKADAAYLPLDPAYPPERLALIVEDAGVDLVVTEGRLAASFGVGIRTVLLDEESEAIGRHSSNCHTAGGTASGDRPQGLAYLIYTSGSTGKPKGVMVPHGTVANFFVAMNRVLGEDAGCWLATSSISFDISVLEILWTLSRGYRVVVRESDSVLAAATDQAPARPVDFSLFYFASDAESEEPGRGKYRLLLEAAQRADRLGFKAVWTPERHFHAFGGLYPNPSVTGAALAAVTERLEIRAGSVVLPLHHPVRVVEDWSVIDNLSDGRVGLAFASGWNAADFVFAPDNYARRKEIMAESIDVVRRLWRGETVTLPGGEGPVEVRVLPRPVQPELPIWITAAGHPETFRLAGELGANVLTHLLGQGLQDVGQKIEVYRRAWREAGHPGQGVVSLMLHTFVKDGDDARETVREPLLRYLETSFDLMKVLAPGEDLADFGAEDRHVLLDRAFDRYYETSGLFGTVDGCRARVRELQGIGVDEIACLIDFGIETDRVLDSLEALARLRQVSQPVVAPRAPEETVAEQIRRWRVSHFQLTPSALTGIVSDPETTESLTRLERLLVGGEMLPQALAERAVGWLGGKLLNMYGPTETTIWSAVDAVDGRSPVTIGRPIANTRLYVVDRGADLVPISQPGELWIGGDGVVRGYFERPGLTAERFVPDPFSDLVSARLYRTGDRVRRQVDGRIVFLGRVDHQVKVRGHRIELGEIEGALTHHPAVREAVVLAREETPGDLAGVRLVAYLVPVSAVGAGAVRSGAEDREGVFDAEQCLGGHVRHQLPDGRRIAHLSAEQTSTLYREIFEDEIYLRHGIELPSTATIFDAGANIGLFSLFVHDRCPQARIFSFEPIPPTFEVLAANVAAFGGRVQPMAVGLSDREEEVEFTFYPRMAGLSGRFADDDEDVTRGIIETWLASQPGGDGLSRREVSELVTDLLVAESHRCRLRPLSALIHELGVERIDLLKIDVERSELRLLHGIEEEDWPKIGQMVIEVHTRELLDEISTLLDTRGYEQQVDEFMPTDGMGGFVWMLYARRPDWDYGVGATAEAGVVALDVAELRATLERRLPTFMWPSAYVVLDALPVTPNGKVDRRALPAPAASSGTHNERIPPETELQRAIARVWDELLPGGPIGIRDNFFEVGANSLLLVEAHGRLRRALGREVPLTLLLRAQNIEALAKSCEEAWADGRGMTSGSQLIPFERAPRNGAVPLSFPQQRIWFLHRLTRGSSAFNVAYAFRLRGQLDEAALEAGFTEIARRHEMLRTRIRESEGTPVQEVLPPAPLTLPTIDLRALPDATGELRRLAAAAAARPFDLESGKLLRALLLRPADVERVLIVSLHHIAVDAWSLDLLFGELSEIYTACREGRPQQLPELPFQYADYVAWQQRWAEADGFATGFDFWRRQLASPPPVPLLPGQLQRNGAPRFRGAVHRFELEADVAEAIRRLARSESGTIFMTLLAAFSALLHQYNGQEDLLVGTNVANRNRDEVRDLIGYFVNNLTLRPDLSGNPTFRELLSRVREMTLEAYSHQDVPFEKVLAELRSRHHGGDVPLFKVMFVMQSITPALWSLPGLVTEPFELDHQTTNFDLTVFMAEGNDRILGAFLFDTDLFEAAAVERMVGHFEGLLASIASDPDQPISRLDLGRDTAADLLADQFNEETF